jgi:hypothetical protein
MDNVTKTKDLLVKRDNWFTLNCDQQDLPREEWCGMCIEGRLEYCVSERMVTNRPDFAWGAATRDEDCTLIPRTIAAASHFYIHGLSKDTGGSTSPPFVEWSDCAIRRGDLEMVTADGPMPRYLLAEDVPHWDEAHEMDRYNALHGINSEVKA